MKKIIGILIVSTLVMIGALGSVTPAKNVDFVSESSEKRFEYVNGNEYDAVVTAGPISSLLEVSEIDLIDGDPAQIQEIEQLLNINYSLNNIGFKIVECSNLSFSITYHWKYKFRPLYRFSFFTTLVDNERYFLSYFFNSIPFLGRNHTVTIEGFNGDLFVARFFRMKLLMPVGQFCFWGEYEEVTIIR
ncbi:MAG: hypothetical protein KAQ84_01530 [Thermoplasmatales archaeon]|nr:hypothetical protein [Thermoplasmatales archaeon]